MGNNRAISQAQVSVSMTTLSIDGPAVSGQFAAAGDVHCYQITPPVGETVHISLTGSAGSTHLYLGAGYVPSRDGYAARSTEWNSPDASLSITAADGETYYILAQADSVSSAPETFSIAAEHVGFSVYSVTPDQGGTGGMVTMTIAGDGFPTGSSVELVTAGGTTLLPRSIHQADSERILATFDLSAAPMGPADVVVYDPTGASQKLSAAFQIVQSSASGFWFHIDAPAAVRAGSLVPFTLSWGNQGNVDAPMELIEIPVPANVTLSTTPGGVPVSRQLLLLTTVPDSSEAVLPPDYRASMQLYAEPRLIGMDSITLTATTVAITDPSLSNQTVGWDSMKAACQPPSLSGAAWDAFWSSLTGQLGSNWAEMLGVLSQQALLADQTQPYQLPDELTPAVDVTRAMLPEVAIAEQAASTVASSSAATVFATAFAAPAGDPAAPANPPSLPGQVHALIVTMPYYSTRPSLPGTVYDGDKWKSYLRETGEVSDVNWYNSRDAKNSITAYGLWTALGMLAANTRGERHFLNSPVTGTTSESSWVTILIKTRTDSRTTTSSKLLRIARRAISSSSSMPAIPVRSSIASIISMGIQARPPPRDSQTSDNLA